MDNINRRVVILSDSRGAGLQDILDINPYLDYTVKSWGGHSIMPVTLKGLNIIEEKQPSLVIVFAGITQITKVLSHYNPWKIIVRNKSTRNHIEDFLDDVELSNQTITDHCNDKYIEVPKVIYSTITGADLSKYNKVNYRDYDQDKLNYIIEQVNRGIIDFNSRSPILFTPWCSKFCHRYKQGKYSHKFKALYDGLHGEQVIREKWANELHIAAIKTLGLNEYIDPKHIKITVPHNTESEHESDRDDK